MAVLICGGGAGYIGSHVNDLRSAHILALDYMEKGRIFR